MNYLKINILVVEDNLQDYIIFKEILGQIRDFFIHIEHAETLEQAVDLVNDNVFDIIFLDLFLPDSFGQETFTSLHRGIIDTPIVILSGLSDKNIALEIVKLGAQDYIVKGEFDSNLLEKSIIYSIERKKFQDKLLKSEKKYKSTFQSVGVAIGDYDYSLLLEYLTKLKQQGVTDILKHLNINRSNYMDIRSMLKLQDLNPETLNLYGCKSVSDFRTNVHKFYSAKSTDHMESLVLAIWNNQASYEGEAYFLNSKGEEICTWKHAKFLGNEFGYYRMLMSTTNISAMKEKEREVFHQAKLLQGISNGAGELISSEDTKEALSKAMKVTCQALDANLGVIFKLEDDGKEAQFKIIKTWNGDDQNSSIENLNASLLGINSSVFESHFDDFTSGSCVELRTEEGQEILNGLHSRICNLIGAPILVNNAIWGTLLVIRDEQNATWSNYEKSSLLTVARNMGAAISKDTVLEALEELNDTLEVRVTQRTDKMRSAIKELESFSYSISHDLRAPLRAISSFSQVLDEETEKDLNETHRSYLGHIIRGAQEMSDLIDDLLNFSRMGRLPLNHSMIDLEALVNEVIQELTISIEDQEISFLVHNLPKCQGDKALVRQVLVNLIWNAIKYSKNKPKTSIEIGSNQNDDFNEYWVKDNGVGFDMAFADKLFGVFQRLHHGDDFDGTGVGLAIVKRIVDRHGGFVKAYAEVENGATFYFSVPSATAKIQKPDITSEELD
ncbi:MAG: signal transduction histidine kinase/CheY-like chemotaxis protein [Litorivivens sp.]|jgi:signal transduction histidine kinase/CheY-like chemotaxis protein